VQSTGLLADDAIEKALHALKRFRALCDALRVPQVLAIATAACRDARNGPAFIAKAQRICGVPVTVLSGHREAQLTALGVVSGIYKPDGIAADLGGGSLELVNVRGAHVSSGTTLPFGGLALQDVSGQSISAARRLVRNAFKKTGLLAKGKGRTLYAVGGTWRALARLHMAQTGYPFHVMQNYRIPAREALAFSRRLQRVDAESVAQIGIVSAARRPLLPYAAVVLENLVDAIKPRDVVISVLGVREGLLYSLLAPEERKRDGLIVAAQDLNQLRARSPRHGEEMFAWTGRFLASLGLDESADERRLRHAACLLADIGWRAHPDYRGEQSMNIVAHGAFVGIDHPGRVFLALTVYFRHAGLSDDGLSPWLCKLATARILERARVLGAAMRVAYLLTAGQGGVLPDTPLAVNRGRLELRLKGRYAALSGGRVFGRLRQLARLIGREPVIVS
jgi:exopolyphosphatase/guanosine-5'-triphosphate,3'-diphosphate pyrophosphatase